MRVAASGRLRSREVVVSDPGGVGTTIDEQLSHVALTAVGGAPEGVVEIVLGGPDARQLVANAVRQAERGGLPQGGARAAFEQPAGGLPLAEGDGVGHRRAAADDGAVGLDV